MPLFEVSVGVSSTATVEIEAENEDEAYDKAHEMIDDNELDFEEDGSYNIEVMEI